MAMKLIGRTGAVAGRDAVVVDLLRVGAAADNELRLAIQGVSRHHARITRVGEAYWLEDAGSTNGTFLNGQRVQRERLEHLDVITLGRDVDLIALSGQHDETAPVARERSVTDARLELLDGAEKGTRLEIPTGELTLGRLAPSNVLFDSPAVGRLHARIQRTADHVIVQDLGSANGTFVNQKRIDSPTVLRDGDDIALAGVRHMTVHITGTAPADAAGAVSRVGVVFDQEWKTRLVWSDEELAMLEQERLRIVEMARAQQGTPPAPAAAPPRVAAVKPAAEPPAAPKAPVAAKPIVASPPSAKPAAPIIAPPVAAKPAEPKPTEPVTQAPEPKPRPAPPATVGGSVRAVRLSGPHGAFTLETGQHRVGRAPDAAVSIPDPRLSRNHAIIAVSKDGVRVEDTNSANGTRVNGKDIQKPAVVKDGDKVSFGDLEFTVELLT